MQVEQAQWSESHGWEPAPPGKLGNAQLVLLFGSTRLLSERKGLSQIREVYPKAHILGCSTSGEICGVEVSDDTLVCTAAFFERTQLKGTSVKVENAADSFAAGQKLAGALETKGLVHVFVISDGLKVNGSELVKGLVQNLPSTVSVTGGLSGDGDRFQKTLVLWDGEPEPDTIAAVGFYGDSLKVGCGSLGGWDPFGPERQITKSKGNVLFQLDGKSALELYKNYLGDHAKDLPASGLLFPLSLRPKEGEAGVVRTILSIDEKEQSLTFAGDVPEGSYAQLMKANFDRLIDGAVGAAKTSYHAIGASPELAVLISCVGRKLVLKQRIEEEVEGVRDIMGNRTVLTGFYSYGEISPFTPNAKCELHNQTMTITTFSEK